MENVFQRQTSVNALSWDGLGDTAVGRGGMGEQMWVRVHRLSQYAMRQVLRETYGEEQATALFRRAGQVAGSTFALGRMKLDMGLDAFAAQLQQVFSEEKIGILRLEEFDSATGRFVLTVGEDLGCSGLPVTNEMVCSYDEGFLAGILKEYTGVSYSVKEIDCWANGGRVCRFQGVPGGEGG